MNETIMENKKNNILVSNLFAGIISGLMTVIAGISYATLVFSGPASEMLSLGITSALISSTIIGLFLAIKSSSPVTIAGPDANISAVLAGIISIIVSQSIFINNPQSAFTMVWITLAVSSLLTGVFLYFVGRFKLGVAIRFIPYPVIGGFLAGTGWLLVRGSFKVMCGVPLTLKTLEELAIHSNLTHWLPGAVFGVFLLIILRRYKHFLVMPIILISTIIATHLIFVFLGISLDQAMTKGWLLSPFPQDLFMQSFQSLSFSGFVPHIPSEGVGDIIALMIISAMVILLNAASVELTTGKDIDLDRELSSTGFANILVAPLGGMTGCMALSRTILNFKAGAVSRLSGIVAALFCGVLLLFAAQALALFPRPVLGGLLLYLGLSLLAEWVWDGWKRLSKFDLVLVMGIIIIIAIKGFLWGVGTGLVVSCLIFAFNYGRTGCVRRELTGSRYHSNVERSFSEQDFLIAKGDGIRIFQLQGFLFFGMTYTFLTRVRDQLSGPGGDKVQFVVLDHKSVPGLDSSSVMGLKKLFLLAKKRDTVIVFSGLNKDVEEMLMKENFLAATAIYPDLDRALGWCEDELIKKGMRRQSDRKHDFESHFAGLFDRPDLIGRLMKKLERLEVKAGYVLFNEGNPCKHLYFLVEGEVTASMTTLEGDQRRVGSMGPGTVIGEMGLYLGSVRSASAVAEKDSIFYRMNAETLQGLDAEDPELAAAVHRFFVLVLSRRLTHANDSLAVWGR